LTIITPKKATIIPVVAVLVLLLIVIVILIKRHGKKQDDWEISYEDLDINNLLGTGSFGSVYRATWKGSEVAVKVMISERVTKEMEKSFKDEVRVMTALRHPNVVLFMAACTTAPKMCIVMEYMALGSLCEVLPLSHAEKGPHTATNTSFP
jgi:hypothetical protein